MENAPALNVLPEPKQKPLFVIFLSQFRSFLTMLLFLAATVSFVVADFLDGSLILAIIFLNGAIGFLQEYKAKKDVEALRKMIVQTTRVVRNGTEMQIEAKFLRVGDVVVLESGDRIPADGELLSALNMTVDEAPLTGESVPVLKEVGGQVFMATTVLSGRGRFKVLKIGAETKFGQIAKNLESVIEEKTPLEIRVADLSKKIGLVMLGLIAVVFVIGALQGRNLLEMFFSGVALAVAAVPEGLPAVLTIALAVGVRRLSRRGAIVKRLSATEALGSVDVILTDKTGTLTKNEMTVKQIVTVSGERFDVSGVGYSSVGEIGPTSPFGPRGIDEILKICVLCNSSSLVPLEDHGTTFKVLGDTTEGSLLILALKAKIDVLMMRTGNPILEEIPFDSATRVMTVVVGKDKLTKGAPEKLISGALNLSEEEKKEFLGKVNQMASEGLRMVGFSKNGEFLGMVGIYDPPRSEVFDAIRVCKGAGIHVVMATGDYPETARAIASEIGLIENSEEVISGEQLREYSDEVLKQNLLKVRVFARMTPADKLRVVEAYQQLGRTVAVTGDGVNDAPALKRAHVGIAMGITGTDVSKEAADLIITDDNFATIVAAVEEGRVIFVNLLKSIKFLLASNFGEVITVVGALLLGMPIPLSPLALLWINVVSDGMPALALAVDTKDGEILRKSAHEMKRGRSIFGRDDLVFLIGTGVVIGIVTIGVFWFSLPFGEGVAKMVAFSTIVFLDLIVAFLVRGKKQKLFSNKFLLISVLATILIQVVILIIPGLREVFV